MCNQLELNSDCTGIITCHIRQPSAKITTSLLGRRSSVKTAMFVHVRRVQSSTHMETVPFYYEIDVWLFTISFSKKLRDRKAGKEKGEDMQEMTQDKFKPGSLR